MFFKFAIISIILSVIKLDVSGWPISDNSSAIEWVTRKEWGARPPLDEVKFSGKIPFVMMHHTYIPSACYTTESCIKAMRSMQDVHQLENGWSDIGYSFLIGGDGKVYVGRGFNVVGAHAPNYNDKSIGICLIGDWTTELPSEKMLQTAHNLIKYSLDSGILIRNYMVMGHRQVRETECPGQRLFDEIKTWDHFISTPAGPEDPEIPEWWE